MSPPLSSDPQHSAPSPPIQASLNFGSQALRAEGSPPSPHGTIRLGTSSWAYEGWHGQVYHRRYPASRFSRDCLGEYAAFAVDGLPLFTTVGIDHTFYRPATGPQLHHYADLVPDEFRFCLKVWEELTIARYATVPRYGAKQGMLNPHFLDPRLFLDMVAGPVADALGPKLGVFLFEFQRTGIGATEFLDRLAAFLAVLPRHFRYAIEVREPTIVSPHYADILATHGVAHVYNHWTAMPALLDQHARLGGRFTAETVVLRLLTPLGLRYQTAVDRYRPYNRLVQPLPEMRNETVMLVKKAVAQGRSPYVLVNNRAEGNAPLTVQALVELLKRSAPSARTSEGGARTAHLL